MRNLIYRTLTHPLGYRVVCLALFAGIMLAIRAGLHWSHDAGGNLGIVLFAVPTMLVVFTIRWLLRDY